MQVDPTFAFQWYNRAEMKALDFGRRLTAIAVNFQQSCNIGSDDYWRNFTRNNKITRLLELYTTSANSSIPAWTGFVAIKEGYRCYPHPNRPGYAVCTYDNEDSWYVELICATSHKEDGVKGKGAALLEEVKRQAIQEDKQYITLSALPYVIFYYYEKGYRLTMNVDCVEDAQLTEIASYIRQLMKTQGAFKYGEKDVEAPFRDPIFVELLKRAVTLGLGANRQIIEGEEQGTCRPLERCAEDGIFMTLCLREREFQLLAQQPNTPMPLQQPNIPRYRTRGQNSQVLPAWAMGDLPARQDFDNVYTDFMEQ